MNSKSDLWRKFAVLLLALVLIAPILVACDGDDDDDTPTVIQPTTTTPTTTTPVSTESIKIGILQDFSGPGAIAGFLSDGVRELWEWKLEKEGGLLVGGVRRPVEFIKYDMKGEVGLAAAGAKKLITNDKVSVILQGGYLGVHASAVADVTDPLKIPFLTFFPEESAWKPYKWVNLAGQIGIAGTIERTTGLILKVLKPETVAILATAESSVRDRVNPIKAALEDAGVEIVYEQYHQQDVRDFSPFVTAMKFEDPDIVLLDLTQEGYMNINKQKLEMGWDDMTYVSVTEHASTDSIISMKGALGCYVPMLYMPGISENPAAKAFEQEWVEMAQENPGWAKKYSVGTTIPSPTHAFMYANMQVGLYVIQLAGTDDPTEIADTMRSGEVELDTPQGYHRLGTDGGTGIKGSYVRILEGGEFEVVPIPSR